MKIVIFTVDHVYANYLVKYLLEKYNKQISLIVESDVILNNKGSMDSLKRYLRVSGVYYVIAQVIKLQIYKFAKKISVIFNSKDSKFFPFEKKSKDLGIKITKSKNVNISSFEKTLKIIKPDLIISVLFNQIVQKNVIKIPRFGVINFHPAYLPDYKGMSPVFWCLSNKEKYAGVAVHYIDEGIDTGGIIKRKKILIHKNDTEDSLYWRCVQEGKTILDFAIKAISNHSVQTIPNKGGRYFSLPSKEAVVKFKKNHKNFFDLGYYLFNN